MKTDTGSSTLTPAIIALGGIEHKIPPIGTSTETTVKVRLLPISDYPRLFELIEDDCALVDFVTGSPTGWAASLPPPVLLDLLESAMDLNFQSACRWASQRAKTGNLALAQKQIVAQAIPQLLEQMKQTLAASAPAPDSPSTARRPK